MAVWSVLITWALQPLQGWAVSHGLMDEQPHLCPLLTYFDTLALPAEGLEGLGDHQIIGVSHTKAELTKDYKSRGSHN